MRFPYPKYLTDEQRQHLDANRVTGEHAERFVEAGVTDPAQMLHLAANGMDGVDAFRFTEVGITDPNQMISLVKLEPGNLHRITAARKRAGNEIVDRVLSVGLRIGRFPTGTLTGLSRSTKIASELTELSDDALDVTITLAEDHFDTTDKISASLIRETLNIIH